MQKIMSAFRIGFGYDVHPLVRGARFVLGGVEVACEKGGSGHSDADVLVHALIDALLGAAGLRDIGHHFPDTDPALTGADSLILLKRTMDMVREAGYELLNMDATICLQEPKVSQLVPFMLENLGASMNADSSKLSVKATTTEKLGFVGSGEGVSAYAVVLLTCLR